MAQQFTPPTTDDTPRTEADTRGSAALLFSRYARHRRGLNVYKYGDGTYTTADPLHTTAEVAGDVAPVITYYGGHIYTVTDAEAAALAAAGFGANLTAPPNTVDANPPAHTFDPYGADITRVARQLVTAGAAGVAGPNTAPQSGLPGDNSRGYGVLGYGEGAYGL